MRKLATIRSIDEIRPIAGADQIECAVVDGWQVVVKRGEFAPGSLACYLEIDSWVPTELAPFLSKGAEPRVFNGVRGERLRTVKLRGTTSQGLLIPISAVYGKIEPIDIQEGRDITVLLGIQKWEAPIPAQLAGQVRGPFPTAIPKTDQERCQNLVEEITAAAGQQFEITEKLDGSSCTMFLDASGDFHVCSRNLDLVRDNSNSYWRTAVRLDVERLMVANSLFGYALQGELVGPGIQGNRYGLAELDFYVFDVYDTRSGDYLKPDARRSLVKGLGLNHVPVTAAASKLDCGVSGLLDMADGTSLLNKRTLREGFVFKSTTGGMTFKVISNQFLLGEK